VTAAEDRLAALLKEDVPPRRDAAFRIAVLEGIERRRARDRLLLAVAVTLIAVLVLGLFAPAITPWIFGSGAVIGALCTAAAMSWAAIVTVRQATSV